jgi:hypothetical protein
MTPLETLRKHVTGKIESGQATAIVEIPAAHVMRNRMNKITTKTKLDLPKELEIQTAELWLASGAIKVTEIGQENTYYVNEFDHKFYCKNYPTQSLSH